MEIAIIDYGAGNLHSAYNAINHVAREFSGANVYITQNFDLIKQSSHVVLPGVGSFNYCIDKVNEFGKDMMLFLKEKIILENRPFLGICVGMQMLASFGYENGKYPGLDIISGNVVSISDDLSPEQKQKLKIPHMGWDNLNILQKDHPAVTSIKEGDHMYFTHSYYFRDIQPEYVIAEVDYGVKIPAIIGKNNIIATQFHPEKSGEVGMRFLRNFLNMK